MARALVIALAAILILGDAHSALFESNLARSTYVEAQDQTGELWREAEPVKVIMDSTADWGRIVFDDLNGTNTNGLRIRSILNSGWLMGNDDSDVLDAGRKIPWVDVEYDRIVTRRGDMVGFFKGLRDFHYTEAYADLVLEVNINLPQAYLWLMTGGNGTTAFQIVSKATGGTIWRDVVVGSGETAQVKRVMSTQPFFRTGRSESTIVAAWIVIALIVVIVLNFPVTEILRRLVRRKREATPLKRRNSGAVEK